MEGFDIYISSDGYLIIPEYNIKYLVSFVESNIPSMPEINQTSAKIAGKDGDIPLQSTYEPMSFNIVCYTEDNLTPEMKKKEEFKIVRFLNSIKNVSKKFGIEQYEKFYNIRYNENLTTERYPKHLKFSIPLKASDPYARYYIKRKMVGNNTFDSDTIKEAGAIITILGPATIPIISFNEQTIKYNNSVLSGSKLIIDTGNSTITLIDSSNIRSNVMRYYNHQFPKVQNGENEIEIQSGISSQSQLIMEWYDLIL